MRDNGENQSLAPGRFASLKIMKDAGIVKVRKEGTKNYYYFDPETESFEKLISTLQLAREITMSLPDRSGNNE